ncbi:SDR family oxidoreductase [Acidomonas methanolica]|uniref:SDR family oxidoreductase n=1 Tax=Acidomonas methanolica TaxID=437 RepID=UPI00211A1E01|nr:SDR family oxidoreductase [Acidomonas methanolica]MCQ9155181.1 SDR family oxidoreductase [Acidomonas methanolica]
MAVALLTNVNAYAGPGALSALIEAGQTVVCHDPVFADAGARETFRRVHPTTRPIAAQSPDEIHAETIADWGLPDAIVLNDAYPITRNEIGMIPAEDFRRTFEAVVMAPIALAQLFLPAMKARRRGAFVFVTSARETRPEPGYAVPTSMRAATTAFAKALSVEAAPFQIQVNVVGPNYLASELYYPRAKFVDDAAGREEIARIVPFGRLGDPREVGELIAFLASGKSPFMTGQVVYFSGGWP